jgi:hypothetical protein
MTPEQMMAAMAQQAEQMGPAPEPVAPVLERRIFDTQENRHPVYDDEEEGALSVSTFDYVQLPEGFQQLVAEAQLAVLTGRVPIDSVKVRDGYGGKPLAYLPHGIVEDILCKVFGIGNWWLEIREEEVIQHPVIPDRWEVRVAGWLVIKGRDGEILRIPEHTGDTISSNANVTVGQTYSSAYSRLITKASSRIGIGRLSDIFYEEVLVHNRVAGRPRDRDLSELMQLSRASGIQDIPRALGTIGIEMAPWELKSRDRVLARLREVRDAV